MWKREFSVLMGLAAGLGVGVRVTLIGEGASRVATLVFVYVLISFLQAA
jgi:hypothetical protein